MATVSFPVWLYFLLMESSRRKATLGKRLLHLEVSFLTARVGPSCPTWLQEGLAQWLEGGDPARGDGEHVALDEPGLCTSITITVTDGM